MLCSLVETAGLLEVFSKGGVYTIFAPTNDAFENALAALGATIDLSDVGLATDVLLQHVISGSLVDSGSVVLFCDKEVEMANGNVNLITCNDDIAFISGDGNGSGPNPQITKTDIEGCNFIIHRVDGVILPR